MHAAPQLQPHACMENYSRGAGHAGTNACAMARRWSEPQQGVTLQFAASVILAVGCTSPTMASIAEDPSPKRICACFGEVITGDAFGNGRSHPSRIHPRGRHHNSFALASAGDHRRSVCSKLFVAGVVLFLRFMRDARQSSRRSNAPSLSPHKL